MATVLTALLYFSLRYDKFTSLLAGDQLTDSFDIHVSNNLQNVCLYAVLSLGSHFVRYNFGPLRTGLNSSGGRAVAESVQWLSNYEKELRKAAVFNLKFCDILGFQCVALDVFALQGCCAA
jgi:hypothetical protein